LWRTEDLFLQHLQEGIDVYLYYNIFSFGDVLYEEQNYASDVTRRLISRKWKIFDIQNTVENRLHKIVEERRRIIHHLERMIFEIEAFRLLEKKDRIAELPFFKALLKHLLSTSNSELKSAIEILERSKKHIQNRIEVKMFDQVGGILDLVLRMYADIMNGYSVAQITKITKKQKV